ncbi:hypothetical protein ONZ45_g6480 [Pleurotus djamor]|nr:hypothetical protein ONZ45_g6480 [Pleurotus djamor]
MSKPSTTASNTLLLRRQLQELTKRPVEGFSAGLVDDDNLYEWEIMIIGPADTLYEGGFFKARLSFPPEFPLLPPKLRFITPMWHPNIYPDGNVCVSILHAPGDDQYGYEDAGERWMPVHTVESILVSVISLLSSDKPNLDSPANVDAAKELTHYASLNEDDLQANEDEYVANCILSCLESDSDSEGELISEPAPLEPDSDSDFNPGEYVYEKKPKASRKTKRQALDAGGSKRKKRKLSHDSDDDDSEYPARSRYRPQSGRNVLLEFLGREIDLSSDEEDAQADDEQGDGPDEEEPEEVYSEQPSSVVSSPIRPKKPTVPQKPPNIPIVPSRSQVVSSHTEDDSVTESDSGADNMFTTTPIQVKQDQELSVTESDSDAEDLSQLELVPSTISGKPPIEFEPEEPEILSPEKLKARPNFPIPEGQERLESMILDEEAGIQVPASINTFLREYQRDGIKFFYEMYKEGHGGLLGDDMGLRDRKRRHMHVSDLQDGEQWRTKRKLPPANATWPTCLIIAPSSVVPNWERELETVRSDVIPVSSVPDVPSVKWGYFEVGMCHGTPQEQSVALRDFELGRLDVVVTSFDLARRHINELDTLPWSCVIVDEVHRLKTDTAKITQALHQFVCTRRFGLTGTAIQNSYDELWTIIDWTNPGRLGTRKQWKTLVAKPLAVGQSSGSSEEERAKGLHVALVLRDKILPKFFLRRTKEIIKKQLPQKVDEVVFCPLTPIQIAVYKRLLEMEPVKNLVSKDDPCDCGLREKRKNCCHPFAPGDLFRYMSILIKLSNHLALILPGPDDTSEQLARHRELAAIAFPGRDAPKYGTAILQEQYCGKWKALDTLLTEWRKDPTNKVLIFTKSVKLLSMLEFHLNNRGYGHLKLEGKTLPKERMPLIDRFHQDKSIFIFLISTMAGGTGLNLTGANKVVVFDPNWNPAHDLQAMDRAYRFGQTRDVHVYRLLGAGSIEELIYARQLYKQQQMAIGYNASIQTRYFQGIQGDTNQQGELFGLKNIFKLHEGEFTTKTVIERASIAEFDWALANLSGIKTSNTQRKGANNWVTESEAKLAHEAGELRGLGTLLLADDIPTLQSEETAIQKTLNTVGVYTHKNAEVLAASKIEEARLLNVLKETRRRKKARRSSTKGKESAEPVPEWPPRRRHKPKLTPQEMTLARQTALFELGIITDPEDMGQFAQAFKNKSVEEQNALCATLDAHIRSKR